MIDNLTLSTLSILRNKFSLLQEKVRESLIAFLKNNSISYFDFAVDAQLSETTILRFCRGDNLKFDTLEKIAICLIKEEEEYAKKNY